MRSNWFAVGALLMAAAVGLGAFGAHGLKPHLSPDQEAVWATAVQYHFIHAIGLLVLGAFAGRLPATPIRWIARLLMAGIVFFSGSLYLLSTRELIGLDGIGPYLGPVTPLGGLCFMAAWLVLFITALRQHDQR
ncbi:MAG: DUF423 domain-containing protein [Flavobacteriales bacterium]|jgi:uncharacterized membrane protein YgdD (TMEM256/DUF423 family)|nr:DUF423 domain-containing protein [Flavobacteriales bacterium]